MSHAAGSGAEREVHARPRRLQPANDGGVRGDRARAAPPARRVRPPPPGDRQGPHGGPPRREGARPSLGTPGPPALLLPIHRSGDSRVPAFPRRTRERPERSRRGIAAELSPSPPFFHKKREGGATA